MNYPYQTDYSTVVHTLSVTGRITPEVARILVDANEQITKLGFDCQVALAIHAPEKAQQPIKDLVDAR